MKIRHVKDEDYEEIARLRSQTIRYVNSKDYSEAIIHNWSTQTNAQDFRENAHKYKRWVAIEENIIIGFCEHNFICELTRIYVHKDYLRKGLGTLLLKTAEDSLKKQGCKEIHIESTITAKAFYEKNGYQIIKKTYYKGNRDAPVYEMSKIIR